MLRISKIMDYGTLVLTHMAGAPTRVYSAADLAATLGLGQPTVSKILKLLGQQGLVRSSRGARGGYALGRPAEDISVADVVDALEEQPFGLTECTALPGACSVEAGCQIRSNWQRINAIVRRTLEDVSIADMVRPNPTEFSLNRQPLPRPEAKSRVAHPTTWSIPE
ncbi:SUF system Fe-S cluster assembly regulator [Allopusillimonas ginsengisoli]|uniref:SUF system Fe-S cluster assembly regulator n=1 Tax=Allopusillimonas ginsengisoli TaxID=453575 RepID=UPI00102286DB|nr:SUF system Fe-S cluster assembly regulator [Allopusillimonas ginsengisoli]TEA70379.1 SUF system Fe-S cluster assembly regulator [Allopusillimonas ginsengisoli]